MGILKAVASMLRCMGSSLMPVVVHRADFTRVSAPPTALSGGMHPVYRTLTPKLTYYSCCKVDACKAGAKCPEGDLAGAFLDRPNMFSVYAPSQSTPSPSSSPPPSNEPKTSNGAIIGGAVGGAVVVALIIGVGIFLLCRRRRRNQHQSSGEVVGAVTASTPMMNEKSNHRRNISESYGMQSRKFTPLLASHDH